MTDLTLNFKVNDTGSLALQKATNAIKDVDKSIKVLDVAAGVYLGKQIVEVAKAIYDFSRGIASAGNDIEKMSRVFNMTTDEFQKWSYVTKMADVDIEGFGAGFKFLTRSMSEALQGSGDAAKSFNLLGINLKDATGRTKDQQTVMMETIGSLEKYAEGVNRDALMLAIFGRGWMSIKPLVDQGTKTIEANRLEIEKFNLIIGKDTIKSLSESEDAFKRWEYTWKISRMQTFTPMVEIFGSMLERIMALKRAWSEGGITGVFKDVIAAQEEERIRSLPSAEWTKQWVAGWNPTAKPMKTEAPKIVDPDNPLGIKGWSKTKVEEQLRLLKTEVHGTTPGGAGWGNEEILGLKSGQMEMDGMKISIQDYTAGLDKMNEALQMAGIETQDMMDAFFRGDPQGTIDLTNERTKSVLDLKKELADLTDNTQQSIAMDKALEDEFIRTNVLTAEQIELIRKLGETRRLQKTDEYKFFQNLGAEITDTFSNNFTKVIMHQESFSAAMKAMWSDLASYVIQQILRMVAMQALLGSAKTASGAVSQGTGLVGFLGNLFRGGGSTEGVLSYFNMKGLQEGGLITKPTPAIVGEHGPEAVIPLKGGKIPVEGGTGGTQVTYVDYSQVYVNALDSRSFEDALNRNKSSMIKILKKNVHQTGGMRDIIRDAI